ncbi:FAD dependent oxidoreductase [Arcticibacter tournemirensis]|uniref:FAD-dependent oxidoreductase n=1 Tax=Arcticibacter tournemirensis TaxID=699437 RepID=A0A5M9HHR3_9SPHI|nr:FAD-dependent oxidoreductase [Arcticibacter tournemirensis]KAA8485051.1 FAD-dependent oxidoreductase [Arcticibacter tournemirensis]TQM50493.1 FAD dependent oxidoreductase [Arcticibacter tournemirensis]
MTKKLILIIFFLGVVWLPRTIAGAGLYDICVYGESASGVIAAVQGARMGKKVVLISKNRHVGGLATSGLTATDMNRNDLVGGITQEFYKKIYSHYLNPEAWKNQDRDSFMTSTLKRTYRGKNDERGMQWVYESYVAEQIMIGMLKDAGVEVLYNERLNRKKAAMREGNKIKSILLESGKIISARMFIDASYEGDLLANAGVSYIVGREANSQYNETFNGIRVNYDQGRDMSSINPYVKEGKPESGLLPYITPQLWGEQGAADKRVQAYCYRLTLTNDPRNKRIIRKPNNYQPLWYELLARQLRAEPETKLEQIITLTPMPNKKTDTNHLDFFGASYDYAETDYKTRDVIERQHKDYALGMLWFLANDRRVPEHIRLQMREWGLPKDEFSDTDNFPYQIYVREARRMVGSFIMTEKNVIKNGRVPAEHSVGLGSYALDCHYVSRLLDKDGKLKNEGTIFSPTVPYTISYYSIVPKEEECANLLVPVCMSASHVAYSSIRMEPVYMILGQSAATAACIAIDSGLPVQRVSYDVLRDRLLKDGQLLLTPEKDKE